MRKAPNKGLVSNLIAVLCFHTADKQNPRLDAYFENGGTQTMITVIGRKDLQEAMAHPEIYRSLLIRVGGFSARCVELEKNVQQEVLSRTVH